MNKTELVLVLSLWLFAFVALVFEPLYYFGCDWSYDKCSSSPYQIVRIVGEMWAIYCPWDPLFWDIPSWLKIMCIIEVVIFGPLYAVVAYGLQYKRAWVKDVALPFSGALFYSTVVYFAMEVVYHAEEANLLLVFVINIPWSIIPVLLAYYVVTAPPGTQYKNKKAV
jgi:hypothetical protein